MTVEYLAYQLIDGYGKDDQTTSFLDDYDFYIIPIVNPDGFVWTQSTERLWRKNRTPPLPGADESASCWGIDLNRNYPHEWNTTVDGSSPDPCSEAYAVCLLAMLLRWTAWQVSPTNSARGKVSSFSSIFTVTASSFCLHGATLAMSCHQLAKNMST